MLEARYTPIALRDKKAIASYLALDCASPQAALSTIEAIDAAIETLKTMPQDGRLVDDGLLEEGYGRLAAGRYWIFYRVFPKDNLIIIQRILHQRRDIAPQMYYDIDF